MYSSLTIGPAYGRDYKSKSAALADWNAGKDFVAYGLSTGYVNKTDLQSHPHGFTHLHIRYRRLEQIAVIAL